MEEEEGNAGGEQRQKKGYIKIPSYEEVTESYQKKDTPPSLFTPSPSFSQAFSFIKNTEFYNPPPVSLPRQVAQSEPSSSAAASSPATASASAAASSSTPYPSAQSRNSILVSHRQKGNPLLKHIRNVRWMFADIVCDYLLGQSSCALYLSLRYHLLHPDYLYFRIRELQKNFKLRVVLCHVDVEDVIKPLLEVTRTALLHDCTLLCGWSLEECGRYLETIKVYENKPADSIQERMDTDYMSRLNHALTAVRHVNKNDVVTLGSAFGSLSRIMDASMEDLARCPGVGEKKVKRLYDTFHEPFRRVVSRPAIIPEASVQEKGRPVSEDDNGVETGNEKGDSSELRKEPIVTVRSALTAAFAKYSEKVRKQDVKNSLVEKGEETSTGMSEMKTEMGRPDEEGAS